MDNDILNIDEIFNCAKSSKFREFGVNLIYIDSCNGLGTLSQTVVKLLETHSIPYQLLSNIDATPSNYFYGINIIINNAQAWGWSELKLSTETYNICLLSWELETYKLDWSNLNKCNEIWTISSLVYKDIQIKSLKPAFFYNFYVPSGITVYENEIKLFGNKYGIPTNKFVFSFIFDCESIIERKNIKMLYDCFTKLTQSDKHLLIKINNFNLLKTQHKDLYESITHNENITLISNSLTKKEIVLFYRISNLYVSTHRAEGLGYTILEAIENGCPVLCTDYGGFKDIVNPTIPLKWTYTNIEAQCIYYGHYWAEPDENDLLSKMIYAIDHYDDVLNTLKEQQTILLKHECNFNKRLYVIHHNLNNNITIDNKFDNSKIFYPLVYKYHNHDLFSFSNDELTKHYFNNGIYEKRIVAMKQKLFDDGTNFSWDGDYFLKTNGFICSNDLFKKEYKINEYFYNFKSKFSLLVENLVDSFNTFMLSQIFQITECNQIIKKIICRLKFYPNNNINDMVNYVNLNCNYKSLKILLIKMCNMKLICMDELKNIINMLNGKFNYLYNYNLIWSNKMNELADKYANYNNDVLANMCNKIAILVEGRCDTNIPTIVKHYITILGKHDWDFGIVCTNANYLFLKQQFVGFENIKLYRIDVSDLKTCIYMSGTDESSYNTLFKSLKFWNMFKNYTHALIYQMDTFIFKPIPNNYFKYAYVGAPWLKADWNIIENNVGNGGLSLRNIHAMIDIIQKHNANNNLTDLYLPEDCYFVKYLHKYNYDMPNETMALLFSSETIININSIGIHKPNCSLLDLTTFLSTI